MTQESLKIILRTYSKGGLNENEAVQLIEDLYSNKSTIIHNTPSYPAETTQPWITYTPEFPKYKVTCKTK